MYTDVMEKASHDGFWPRRLCHSRRNKFRMFPQPSRQRFNAIRAGAENKPVLFHCCYHIHPNFRWPHLRRRQGHPTFALPVIRKKFHFFLFLLIRKHGPDDAVWISDFEMNSSQGRVKVSWEPPSNSPFVEEKKEKKTPNQYTYAYGGCGAVMATLLGRAAFPLTWTRYWHMALFIFFASLVLPASTSGWFITFSVDIHTPFPEWGGASTSRVILISNNGVEGWAAFPGTRWTKKKKRALDVSLLPNDYYKRDTSRYSFSRGCGRRNVEGRSPRFIAPKVPAEFLSLPFRALICLNTLALIQSASSTCAGFQQQYWFWEISS